MTPTHPDDEYIQAFRKFCGAKEEDLHFQRIDRHLWVKYRNNTYLISHFDDIKEDYRYYFEKYSYDELYTQTYEQIWQSMIEDEVSILPEIWIVGIYREWISYWEKQKSKIVGGAKRYNEFRQRSWEDLQILMHVIQSDPEDLVRRASEIDGLVFMPLIALVIKDQYEDFEEFLDTVTGYHTEYGEQLITMGDTFEEIDLNEPEGEIPNEPWEPNVFYIYNTEIEMDEKKE